MGAVYSCSPGGGAVLLQAVTNGDDTTFRKVRCGVCCRPGLYRAVLVLLVLLRLSVRCCEGARALWTSQTELPRALRADHIARLLAREAALLLSCREQVEVVLLCVLSLNRSRSDVRRCPGATTSQAQDVPGSATPHGLLCSGFQAGTQAAALQACAALRWRARYCATAALA